VAAEVLLIHIPENLQFHGSLFAPRSEGTTQKHETKSQHGVPIDLRRILFPFGFRYGPTIRSTKTKNQNKNKVRGTYKRKERFVGSAGGKRHGSSLPCSSASPVPCSSASHTRSCIRLPRMPPTTPLPLTMSATPPHLTIYLSREKIEPNALAHSNNITGTTSQHNDARGLNIFYHMISQSSFSYHKWASWPTGKI